MEIQYCDKCECPIDIDVDAFSYECGAYWCMSCVEKEGVMIYKVKLYYSGAADITVEAKDEEHAEELAIDKLYEGGAEDNLEVNDVVVLKSDNQYTDEQELRNGERRRGDG